jgi:DNA-binding winged helix-turn-helix (wHTH) protein
VDVHVATLRKKLGDKGRHIRTLPKIGYLWDPKSGDSKAGDSKAGDSKAADSGAGDSRAGDHK